METLCCVWSHWRAVKWRVVHRDYRQLCRRDCVNCLLYFSEFQICKGFWCLQEKKLLLGALLKREHSPHPAMPLLSLKHCSNRQIEFIADVSGVLCYLVNFMTLKSLILDCSLTLILVWSDSTCTFVYIQIFKSGNWDDPSVLRSELCIFLIC